MYYILESLLCITENIYFSPKKVLRCAFDTSRHENVSAQLHTNHIWYFGLIGLLAKLGLAKEWNEAMWSLSVKGKQKAPLKRLYCLLLQSWIGKKKTKLWFNFQRIQNKTGPLSKERFTECVVLSCGSSPAKQVPYCFCCTASDPACVSWLKEMCGPWLGYCSLSPLMRKLFSQTTGLRCWGRRSHTQRDWRLRGACPHWAF